MSKFKLRFPDTEIAHWANLYSYPDEDKIEKILAPRARARGHLTRAEFLAVCEWKTPRSKPKCERNSAERVREATRLALNTNDERVKIGVLRLLDGVEWPTASVILHFCDALPYPILDYRALWSLGYPKPPTYTVEFWQSYVDYTRELARRTNHSMRVIDRALWQFSKDNQPGSGS